MAVVEKRLRTIRLKLATAAGRRKETFVPIWRRPEKQPELNRVLHPLFAHRKLFCPS
jgi:hypothetical protein